MNGWDNYGKKRDHKEKLFYFEYDKYYYILFDDEKNRIEFVLKPATKREWNMCWEKCLIEWQLWMEYSLPKQKKWDFVMEDAMLIQFVNQERKNMPKFNCFFANEAKESCIKKILKHVNANVLLNHLEDVYYLVGSYSSDAMVSDNGRKWKDLMPPGFPDEVDNGKFVLGMCLITMHFDESEKVKWVELDLIESYLAHVGTAQLMIDKLENRFQCPVIPTDITTNMAYWKKNLHGVIWSCLQLKGSDYYKFAVNNIKGFWDLFHQVYLHYEPPQHTEEELEEQTQKKAKIIPDKMTSHAMF